MASRRLIRLSQLPERLVREKLEDSDWVTFGVLVNKATQQSNSSVGLFLKSSTSTILPLIMSGRNTVHTAVFLTEHFRSAGKILQHLEAERPPQPGGVCVFAAVR